MAAPPLDTPLVARLYKRAKGSTWQLPQDVFAEALHGSATRVLGDEDTRAGDLERRLAALHLEDLALACACAVGNEAAWEHFIREQRPHLYRSADAIDPTGNARDLPKRWTGPLRVPGSRRKQKVALPLFSRAEQSFNLVARGPGTAARRSSEDDTPPGPAA